MFGGYLCEKLKKVICPGFDLVLLGIYDGTKWGKRGEGYTGPLCTIFATSVNLISTKFKITKKEKKHSPCSAGRTHVFQGWT